MCTRPKTPRLPANQQLVAIDKWPTIGEKTPASLLVESSEARAQLSLAKDWQLRLYDLTKDNETQFADFEVTLDQLRQLPWTEITTDIHCVTRWSKFDMKFGGVLFKDLLDVANLAQQAKFVSFVSESSRNHSTSLPLAEAIELGTLLVLDFEGGPLPIEHGGPLRTVVPGKYFYKSLKWLKRIDLLNEDRLGYWEAESGYHNGADPWLEQRYIAPTINKQTAQKLIESRDFSGKDLRSMDASDRNLDGLKATQATMRNANFTNSSLVNSNFTQAILANADFRFANLQNAVFEGADLEGANFCGADLRLADLRGASLFGATFYEANDEKHRARLDAATRLPENWREALGPTQQKFLEEMIG